MLLVHYPEPVFQVKRTESGELIFDPLRRKWLRLTPEEWVRQNFVQYLVQVKQYPAALIAMEKIIRLGELKKRFDILVYDQHHHPWMMVECKAPSVKLDETVLHQLLRYHISVPTGFLVISNGNTSYGWQKKDRNLLLLNELPDWIRSSDTLPRD
jgi:hypothetical protein